LEGALFQDQAIISAAKSQTIILTQSQSARQETNMPKRLKATPEPKWWRCVKKTTEVDRKIACMRTPQAGHGDCTGAVSVLKT